MKKLTLVLCFLILTLLVTSIVSASFLDTITGNPVKTRDAPVKQSLWTRIFGGEKVAKTAQTTVSCCECMDSQGNYDWTMSPNCMNVPTNQRNSCEAYVTAEGCNVCPECDELKIGKYDGDITFEASSDNILLVYNPKVNGASDEIKFSVSNNNGSVDMNVELDMDLDISNLIPGETSADAVKISTKNVADGLYLRNAYYSGSLPYPEINAGINTVFTDEIWLWYNDGDATAFGGNSNANYVTVFYKNSATNQIEWFGSALDGRFVEVLDHQGNILTEILLDKIDSDKVVIRTKQSGQPSLKMNWGLTNGDFSKLGSQSSNEESDELTLRTIGF